MKFRCFSILLGVLLAMPHLAAAQTRGEWRYEQRGSIVTVVREGQQLFIAYVEPSAQRRAEGVAAGSELFTGTIDRNDYAEGMAWLYRSNCRGTDYYVYGDFKPGQPFKLAGAAPVLGSNCAIIDNVYDNGDANLIFMPVAGAQPAPRPVQGSSNLVGGERMCTTGVAEGSWLNVRVGPGSDYAQIAVLARGECNITILHECTGDWCPILRPAEMVGWVSSRFLRPR